MSRRSNRRERRFKKREEKKQNLQNQYDNIENVISYSALYNSAFKCSLGVFWKQSVQRFMLTLLFKICELRKAVKDGKDVRRGFIEFDINERGKTRHIKSVHFSERIIQKALCSGVLIPAFYKSLIADNSASQIGKGTTYATERLTEHLRKFYRKHSQNGYVLLIDFSNYFGNIEHKPLKDLARKRISDKDILKLNDDFIDACGERGLGLGSEISQVHAVNFINDIDHYIKEIARVKYYGRYMDDSYFICESKERLQNLLKILIEKYKNIGVVINQKKTVISDLKHGFIFLKTRFYITPKGKIIRRPCRKSITQERRKLKKQAKLLEKGILKLEDIKMSFESWRGSMKRRNAFRTVKNMTALFNKLFTREKEKLK